MIAALPSNLAAVYFVALLCLIGIVALIWSILGDDSSMS